MREKLIELIQAAVNGCATYWAGLIADHLIASGVAIPVRCKDCKYWKPGDSFGGDSLDDMQRIGRCPIVRFGRRENDYCCEGERRTDDST